MRKLSLIPALFLLLPLAARAQEEGLIPTQVLVHPDGKRDTIPAPTAIQLKVENRDTPINSLIPLKPANTQIALLIDDGLSRSAGIQLNDMKAFAANLAPGTEILVGYMQNGTVRIIQPFTRDHAAAADVIRLPLGSAGISASPYFCLQEFVKHWPGDEAGTPKARTVIMITNGVDPYNGSTSVLNQDSPYVQHAIEDAQRAGVAVSSIYYRDAGFGGGFNNSASFSGQSYLQQLAQGTGGVSYYQGTFNPVSLTPYFDEFKHDLAESYIATFDAPAQAGGRDHLVSLRFSTPKGEKLRHPDAVRPGNKEIN